MIFSAEAQLIKKLNDRKMYLIINFKMFSIDYMVIITTALVVFK